MTTYQLHTIGHSTRSLEEMLDLLKEHKIKMIVDVRTIPKSRRVPWFNRNAFDKSLQSHKIRYLHFPELGGLRHPKKDSINLGWKNSGFRGFADYMQTEDFYQAIDKLNELLSKTRNRIAIMCAEAVPWRCHRSLIADAELIRKLNVGHILSKHSVKEHQLTSFAEINPDQDPPHIYYPAEQISLF